MALEGLSGKHCRERTVGRGLGKDCRTGRRKAPWEGHDFSRAENGLDDGGFSR
jgi:hypothetical protein